jgi:hypothetical protein
MAIMPANTNTAAIVPYSDRRSGEVAEGVITKFFMVDLFFIG